MRHALISILFYSFGLFVVYRYAQLSLQVVCLISFEIFLEMFSLDIVYYDLYIESDFHLF